MSAVIVIFFFLFHYLPVSVWRPLIQFPCIFKNILRKIRELKNVKQKMLNMEIN